MGLFDNMFKKIDIDSLETVTNYLDKMRLEYKEAIDLCNKGKYKDAFHSGSTHWDWRDTQKLYVVMSKPVDYLLTRLLVLWIDENSKNKIFKFVQAEEAYKGLVVFKQDLGKKVIDLAHSEDCLDRKDVQIIEYSIAEDMLNGELYGYLPRNLSDLVAFEYINYYAEKVGYPVSLCAKDIYNFYSLFEDDENAFDRLFGYNESNFKELLSLLGFEVGEIVEEPKPSIIDAIKNYKHDRDEEDNDE